MKAVMWFSINFTSQTFCYTNVTNAKIFFFAFRRLGKKKSFIYFPEARPKGTSFFVARSVFWSSFPKPVQFEVMVRIKFGKSWR